MIERSMGFNPEAENEKMGRLARIQESRNRLLAQQQLRGRIPEYKFWEEIGNAAELEEMYRWMEDNPLDNGVPKLLEALADLERDVQRGTTDVATIEAVYGDAEKYGQYAKIEKTQLSKARLENKLLPILIMWHDEIKGKSSEAG